MAKTHTITSGQSLSQIAQLYGVKVSDLQKANNIADANKIRIGQVLTIPVAGTTNAGTSSNKNKGARRVDFKAYMADKTHGGNRNRPLNIADIEQLQDSLIARGYPEAQRLALLATAAQEMGEKGGKSRGVGGNGYEGLNEARMPLYYLNDNGKQIHYILNDLETTHSDNWLDGGSGGPTIMSGKEGYDKFWASTDPGEATIILNKSYIRPAGRVDSWNNRAEVARGMQKHMHRNGGKLEYLKLF